MKKINLLLVSLALSLASCYYYPDVNVQEEERDITYTVYDTTTNFNDYQTVTVSDTVFVLRVSNGDETDTILQEPYASTIINACIENLLALGYDTVSESANPDLYLTLNVIDDESDGWVNVGGCYYPPYWGWGYWYYPGYCYQYPVYYYDRKGSVIMDLVDLKNYPGNGDYTGLWHASIQAFLNSTNSNTNNRLENGIQEAFDQSPYLKIN